MLQIIFLIINNIMTTFSLISKESEKVKINDSESLIDLFLVKEIEYFELNLWEICKIRLNVEDDIMFLIDAYEEILSIKKPVSHYVFLDDGGAIIKTSLINNECVNVNIKLVPFLDVKNLHEKNIRMSLDDYIRSWKYLAFQISQFISN